MGWKKYKYYIKQPRAEIVKDMLYWLLTVGAVYIAASSPRFIPGLLKAYQRWKKYPRKKVCDTFSRLRRQGLIETRMDGNQIHISLTEEGRKKAGHFQINDLKIKKPKTWDGKWRIVIFDIVELKKRHREAFRGKLKELGFRLLQKSVWLHPFDCEAEIDLMGDFFGLNKNDLQLIVAEKIENEAKIKEWFKI
jgi:hypothetical protein